MIRFFLILGLFLIGALASAKALRVSIAFENRNYSRSDASGQIVEGQVIRSGSSYYLEFEEWVSAALAAQIEEVFHIDTPWSTYQDTERAARLLIPAPGRLEEKDGKKKFRWSVLLGSKDDGFSYPHLRALDMGLNFIETPSSPGADPLAHPVNGVVVTLKTREDGGRTKSELEMRVAHNIYLQTSDGRYVDINQLNYQGELEFSRNESPQPVEEAAPLLKWTQLWPRIKTTLLNAETAGHEAEVIEIQQPFGYRFLRAAKTCAEFVVSPLFHGRRDYRIAADKVFKP